MRLSQVREVRRPLWGLLGTALLLAVAVPTFMQVEKVHTERAVTHMTFIAEHVAEPAVMNPLVLHHDCNGDGLVRCSWTAETNVDGLAHRVQADLSKTAAVTARTRCSDERGLVSDQQRSCMVQVLDGSHAVTIMLDPYVRRVDGRTRLLGTRYVVQAS